MTKSVFSKNMTSNQARMALFTAVEGKSKAEIERIKAEYAKIIPVILDREHKQAAKGWAIG